MISYDMRILSEIALYLETPEDRFFQFLKEKFPDSTIATRVQIVPEHRTEWKYVVKSGSSSFIGKNIPLNCYASPDGALIWIGYAKEIDTFFIRDDGGLKSFLVSTI